MFLRHWLDKIIPSRRERWWIDCCDVFPILSEFIDKELDKDLMAKMERHLEDCLPCRNLFRSLEKTKELCGQAPSRHIPPEVAQDLLQKIRQEYSEAKRHLGDVGAG